MSNVPMTRPEEMLIEHKTAYFTSSTFAELDDGRILRHAYAEFYYFGRRRNHLVGTLPAEGW